MPDGQVLKEFRGLMAELGARIVEWEPGRAVVVVDIAPLHLNSIEVVHGGIFGALIDVAGLNAGIHCSVPGNVRRAVTVSYNVNMMDNTGAGRLVAEGRLRGGGRTIYMSSVDVRADDGRLLATGDVVCRYAPGSERAEGLPAA